jgi:hypothetical protein
VKRTKHYKCKKNHCIVLFCYQIGLLLEVKHKSDKDFKKKHAAACQKMSFRRVVKTKVILGLSMAE